MYNFTLLISDKISNRFDPIYNHNFRYALFMIRCWRNWSIAKFNTIQQCVTTNTYWGLEINAHALILYVVLCRDCAVHFDITKLQSQTCEGIFRDARAFTSTESTVVNFTIQGFESRLNKIQTKRDIMHRENQINFPRFHSSAPAKRILLPDNFNISSTVEQAKHSAFVSLRNLGLSESEISFEQSIVLKKPKDKPSYECGNFEFVSIPEVSTNENIYDATELFPNVSDELKLKNSANCKHVFKIRNRSNKIVYVKKKTFIWMLTSGQQKCSSDRIHRFRDTSTCDTTDDRKIRYVNQILEDVSIGEYILLKTNSQLMICKLYGFKFLNGESCSLQTVPVHVPRNVRPKGVALLGSLFILNDCSGDFILELTDNFQPVDIQCYRSHLVKPLTKSSALFYCQSTIDYIDTFK